MWRRLTRSGLPLPDAEERHFCDSETGVAAAYSASAADVGPQPLLAHVFWEKPRRWPEQDLGDGAAVFDLHSDATPVQLASDVFRLARGQERKVATSTWA